MDVTPSQYVELLNKTLQADENYQEGMRFFLHPEGCTEANCRGIGWEGPMTSIGLSAVVQIKVDRTHKVVLK